MSRFRLSRGAKLGLDVKSNGCRRLQPILDEVHSSSPFASPVLRFCLN